MEEFPDIPNSIILDPKNRDAMAVYLKMSFSNGKPSKVIRSGFTTEKGLTVVTFVNNSACLDMLIAYLELRKLKDIEKRAKKIKEVGDYLNSKDN